MSIQFLKPTPKNEKHPSWLGFGLGRAEPQFPPTFGTRPRSPRKGTTMRYAFCFLAAMALVKCGCDSGKDPQTQAELTRMAEDNGRLRAENAMHQNQVADLKKANEGLKQQAASQNSTLEQQKQEIVKQEDKVAALEVQLEGLLAKASLPAQEPSLPVATQEIPKEVSPEVLELSAKVDKIIADTLKQQLWATAGPSLDRCLPWIAKLNDRA